MAGLDHAAAIKKVYAGMALLAVITLVEVIVSLFGKGHIIPGMEDLSWVAWVTGILIVALSFYKAYFIIYDFMHMKYEVKSLAMTVLIPTALLIWAVIAFINEGSAWGSRRDQIKQKNEVVNYNDYFLDQDVKEIKKASHHQGGAH